MIPLPKRIDNIIYFANELMIKDPKITALIPEWLKVRLGLVLTSNET